MCDDDGAFCAIGGVGGFDMCDVYALTWMTSVGLWRFAGGSAVLGWPICANLALCCRWRPVLQYNYGVMR